MIFKSGGYESKCDVLSDRIPDINHNSEYFLNPKKKVLTGRGNCDKYLSINKQGVAKRRICHIQYGGP